MSLPELNAEARIWKQGIGSLMGFMGLMIAALLNFKLDRRRDAALRDEEMKSVTAALYGEIRMLRVRVAAPAQAIASLHVALGVNARHSIKFDNHFVEANRLPAITGGRRSDGLGPISEVKIPKFPRELWGEIDSTYSLVNAFINATEGLADVCTEARLRQ
jgi:hypothetical protein